MVSILFKPMHSQRVPILTLNHMHILCVHLELWRLLIKVVLWIYAPKLLVLWIFSPIQQTLLLSLLLIPIKTSQVLIWILIWKIPLLRLALKSLVNLLLSIEWLLFWLKGFERRIPIYFAWTILWTLEFKSI